MFKNAYIVLVDPSTTSVEDRLDPLGEPDLAVWLVQEAMDDRPRMRVDRVLKRIEGWKGCDPLYMPPEAAVIGALWHSDTPFGLGYRMPQGSRYRMLVAYKFSCYLQRRNGSLVPTEGPGIWPTPQDLAQSGVTRQSLGSVLDGLEDEGQDVTYLRRWLEQS